MSIHIDNKYIRLVSSRLRNFKQKKVDLYNFSCPICGDSKRNPRKARGYFYKKIDSLFYTCKNCNEGMNVGNFLKAVDPSLYNEYILERYKSGETGRCKSVAPKFNIPVPRFDKLDKVRYNNAEWCSDLPEDHICKRYMIYRKIPSKFYKSLMYTENYKSFVDEIFPNHGRELFEEERLVIPYFNEYNDIIAVSGRSMKKGNVSLRYITIFKDELHDKIVYGLDRINLEELVKVVEGPIDSLFLKNCLASGNANLSHVASSLKLKDCVLIPDNENRNKEIVGMISKAIQQGYKVVIWPDNIPYKDINMMVMNRMSVETIEDIIKRNTFSGIEAVLKLNFWKKV
jgi:hypothetical protein